MDPEICYRCGAGLPRLHCGNCHAEYSAGDRNGPLSSTAVLAERERCEQLFLLFAYDWFGEKIKDTSEEAAIMEMIKDIRRGEKLNIRAVFNPSNPDRQGLPTILLYNLEADFSQETTSPSTTSSADSEREG